MSQLYIDFFKQLHPAVQCVMLVVGAVVILSPWYFITRSC